MTDSTARVSNTRRHMRFGSYSKAMGQRHIDVLSSFLRYTLVGGAVIYLLLYVALACARMTYRYELEWIEGASVEYVGRILDGKQLYVEPSIEFTPYLYPPLYFYVSALVAKVTGLGFLPLRLVSFVSSVGCFALIFLFVRRETSSSFFGTLGAGLFAATYKISGTWFDIARVDTFSMVFVLGGIYALRFGQGAGSTISSGVLLALGFLTKQSTLLMVALLSFYCLLFCKRWSRFLLPVSFLSVAGSVSAVWNHLTDGWYYYYVFDLPSQHKFVPRMFVHFWTDEVLGQLPIAFGMTLAFLVYQFYRAEKRQIAFHTLLFGGMLVSAWLARTHSGTWLNGLYYAHAAIALFLGLALPTLLGPLPGSTAGSAQPSPDDGTAGWFESRYVGVLVLILANLQFLSLAYNPWQYVPTRADAEAGDRFIRLLKGIDGDIFISHPSFLATLAGKRAYSDGGAMADVFRGENEELKRKLEAEMKQAIRTRRFEAIIVSKPWFGFYINSADFVAEVRQHYEDQGPIFDDDKAFFHVTGVKARPDRLYLSK